MRLELTGNIELYQLEKVVGQALVLWVDKIKKDNPEMEKLFNEQLEDSKLISASLDLQFKLKGQEDWQVLSTDNHEGIPELLVVKAETDEKGKLINDSVEDNDGESLFTDFDVLVATGARLPVKEIEGKYPYYPTVKYCGYRSIDLYKGTYHVEIYKVADEVESNPMQVVVRVYHCVKRGYDTKNVLVSEATFPEDKYADLVRHYLELAEAV